MDLKRFFRWSPKHPVVTAATVYFVQALVVLIAVLFEGELNTRWQLALVGATLLNSYLSLTVIIPAFRKRRLKRR